MHVESALKEYLYSHKGNKDGCSEKIAVILRLKGLARDFQKKKGYPRYSRKQRPESSEQRVVKQSLQIRILQEEEWLELIPNKLKGAR